MQGVQPTRLVSGRLETAPILTDPTSDSFLTCLNWEEVLCSHLAVRSLLCVCVSVSVRVSVRVSVCKPGGDPMLSDGVELITHPAELLEPGSVCTDPHPWVLPLVQEDEASGLEGSGTLVSNALGL